MAIYKIFPEKSNTLYSYYPTTNAGIDEILDLSTYLTIEGTNQVSRPLIQFSQSEIENVYYNIVKEVEYEAHLLVSLAHAAQLPLNYTIYGYPVYNQWNVGTGRLANSPATTDGASWTYTDQLNGNIWYYPLNLPNQDVTYHDDGTGLNEGGGLWWYIYESSQDFNHASSKDLNLDVTYAVNAWLNYDIDNNGLILKHSDLLEFSTSSAVELKYFSANTHTIYPPCLEIRWNDTIYNTDLSLVTSPNIIATLANNQSEYQQDSVQRFRINVRDQFPARAFQTSSVYTNNKVLSEESHWQIKDLDTEEIVVDFDPIYTKISADGTSNYFDVYMSGLEPERYYKILIKTIIDGNTLVLDNNYYFKVIR